MKNILIFIKTHLIKKYLKQLKTNLQINGKRKQNRITKTIGKANSLKLKRPR